MICQSKKIKDIRNNELKIEVKMSKILVNGNSYGSEMYFRNDAGGFFKIGKYKYRGDLKIVFKEKLYFINCLDIEEYIRGVLPNEISPKWHIEVIKAQAVAARTFAYYIMYNNKDQIYDLKDDTYSQVYRGSINENKNFNTAIEQTRGQILTFRGELIQAFFHSACGGHTESADKVWGRALSYLKGVPCSYCASSPHYRWESSFTEKEIISKLKVKKYIFEGIRSIRPASRSSSGRWIQVKVIGKQKTVILKGNEFRILLGIKKLRSTKFSLQKHGNKFLIRGKGWGHGVGLCQWGAKTKAEKGNKYYQILRYYYRGTTLKSISSLK